MHEAYSSSTQVRIDSELGKAIRLLCDQERVSPLSCLLAAWAILLMKLSGQDEIVLGQPYSVQLENADLQDIVG
jgi:non-ribosomal peptide synthetase component F